MDVSNNYYFENINESIGHISELSHEELNKLKESCITINVNGIVHELNVTWDNNRQLFGVEPLKKEAECLDWIRGLFCNDQSQLDEYSIEVANSLNLRNQRVDSKRKFADHYSSECEVEVENILRSGINSLAADSLLVTTIKNDGKRELIIAPDSRIEKSYSTIVAKDRPHFLLYGFETPRMRLELRLNKYCNLKENAVVEKIDHYNKCLGLKWESFNFLTYSTFLAQGEAKQLNLMKDPSVIKEIAELHYPNEVDENKKIDLESKRIDKWINCLEQNIEKFKFDRKINNPKFFEFIIKNYKDPEKAQKDYDQEVNIINKTSIRMFNAIQKIKERIEILNRLLGKDTNHPDPTVDELETLLSSDSSLKNLLSDEEKDKIFSALLPKENEWKLSQYLVRFQSDLDEKKQKYNECISQVPPKPLSFDNVDDTSKDRLKEHPAIQLLKVACENPTDPSLPDSYNNLDIDYKDLLDTVLKNAFFRHTSKIGLTFALETGTTVLFAWNMLLSKIDKWDEHDISKTLDYEENDLNLEDLHNLLSAERYKLLPPQFHSVSGHYPITLSEMDELGRLLQRINDKVPKYLLIEKIKKV